MSTVVEKLKKILTENKDKRISVVGTTCTGKTTLLKEIREGISISKLAPPLTKEETEFYYHAPLTRENNRKMVAMRADKAFIKPGQPAFGTAIAKNAELVIYLKISDQLLKERTALRDVDFQLAKNMQTFIEEQIEESQLPVIEIKVG